MKLPYRITEAGSRLYRAGVNYHEFGVIRHSGVALYDYFKADKATPEQIDALKTWCPDLKMAQSQSEYAPELGKVLFMFPKAGWYRQQLTKE